MTPLQLITAAGLLAFAAVSAPGGIIDEIRFGVAASEQAHHFAGEQSRLLTGGLGEPARRLLAPAGGGWEGGSMDFTLKVDPELPNYVTVRFWGSDATRNVLAMDCDGKQVGYRHLGDVDLLDIGGELAAFPGRFIYVTTPLPVGMTREKTTVDLQIRSTGPMWAYGKDFEQFQKNMTEPSRGIYRAYTHTDTCFIPPPDETQGTAVAAPPVRTAPGPEVMEQLKNRVNGTANGLLKSAAPLNEMQMEFLARAYFVTWTPANRNPKVVAQVVKGMDALCAAWRKHPDLMHDDPSTPNPGWFEFGPAGHAVSLLGDELSPLLGAQISLGGNLISRRTAWADLLVAGRDWHRHHRRLYTNQTMINDTTIYECNRGLEVIDPAQALTEDAVRRYFYESVALEPWRDSDGHPTWQVGTNYWQLTAKHLTKELGYVGYYGEVLDWVTSIYNATRSAPGLPGDQKIKAQLEKIAAARAVFRYPGVDEDGFRAMLIEAVVGWRDTDHYPGNVAYAERATWDASPLYAAAATLNPAAIGYVQQMFADGQFFISLKRQMEQAGSLRVTAGLLDVPAEYARLTAQPPVAARLPMTPGQPDFVFSDEEDGVVAVKHGDEILYASLYWRAHHAVNYLARVHYTTPTVDRIAVVRESAEFTPSGLTYTRPDNIGGATPGGVHYPGLRHSAEAGEQLPIVQQPPGVSIRPGEESVYAGKADFYTLRYGDYLIGMNLSKGKTFVLPTPAGISSAKELVSGKTVVLEAPVKVGPQATVVLWLKP